MKFLNETVTLTGDNILSQKILQWSFILVLHSISSPELLKSTNIRNGYFKLAR